MDNMGELELQDLCTVLEINPSDFEIRFERASFYLDMNKYELAINDLNLVIKEDVLDYLKVYTYLDHAKAYERIDKYKEALSDYNKVLEISEVDIEPSVIERVKDAIKRLKNK